MPYGLKTGKKIRYALTFVLAFLQFSASRAQDAVYVTEADIARKAVTESSLRSRVEFLSDSLCGGRATGSPGANAATFWIASQFRAAGFQPAGGTYSRHFSPGGGRIGRNVLGLFRGSSQRPDADYVIVAAAYDGLGTLDGNLYPGADSNASGVAALLGIADMLRALQEIGKTWRHNILFVAIDGKNLNLSGSQALWEDIEAGRLTDPQTGRAITRDRITAFVNIDQVGCSLSPLHRDRPDYLIMLSDGGFFRGNLSSCNDRYGTGLDLGFDYYGSRDFTRLFFSRISDQKIFLDHRVPCVMFTSGITLNNNKVHDTADTLDYPVFKRRVWLMFHWLERIL